MDPQSYPTCHTVAGSKAENTDLTAKDTSLPCEEETYVYEGYEIRIHFRGEKTLMQCILNLAARKAGGNCRTSPERKG